MVYLIAVLFILCLSFVICMSLAKAARRGDELQKLNHNKAKSEEKETENLKRQA